MKEVHICPTEADMIELGKRIAQTLKGGEVFALSGDLGFGKTTFVKGFALGLHSHANVTSPTFNLVHRYLGGRLDLIHYDLYRLKKLEEIEALDLETEFQTQKVIAIEWPNLVESILPKGSTYSVLFEEFEEGRKVSLLKR